MLQSRIEIENTDGWQEGAKICWKLQLHPGQEHISKYHTHIVKNFLEIQILKFALNLVDRWTINWS